MAVREDVTVELSTGDLSRLLKETKEFDPQLMKALRKRLRAAGESGVRDVRARLMGRTYTADVGLAAGLAAGTKVSIKTGLRTAGMSIRTAGSKLPANKQAMVRAYNKPSFRHRVFGRDVWVDQPGRPYFGAVLDEHLPEMRFAVERALRDAAETIKTGRVS